MNSPVNNPLEITTVDVERLVSSAIRSVNTVLIQAVILVMQEEVFMSTLDGIDPVILRLAADQALDVVRGRMARPYLAIEFHEDEQRVLRPDGTFARSPDRPARYPGYAAALLAAESARNRLDGGVVSVVKQTYLPIA